MSIKKMLLLASMALAAVAFAVPASASASRVVDVNGNPVPNGTHIEVTGPAGFSSLGAGFKECIIHTTVESVNGGQTLLATAVEITPHTCVGFGSANFFTGCTVETAHAYPASLPWDIDVTAEDFDLTGVEITGTNSSNCVTKQVDITFGEVTLNPEGPGPLETLTVEGEEGEIHFTDLGISAEEVEAFGELEVVGTDNGTYEIE